MIQIRRGMFETNSSSTHAIIVTDRNCEPGMHVDFAIGEFGWNFEKLSSTNEKASYLYTIACECEHRDVYQDLYKILVKYGINVTCSNQAVFDKYGLDNGYVDHAWDGEAKSFVDRMLHHEKALIRFLFSDESFVVTGNDNCDEDEYKWWQDQQDVDYKHHNFYKGN